MCEPSPGFDFEGLKRHCSQETHDVGDPRHGMIGVIQSVRRLNSPKPEALFQTQKLSKTRKKKVPPAALMASRKCRVFVTDSTSKTLNGTLRTILSRSSGTMLEDPAPSGKKCVFTKRYSYRVIMPCGKKKHRKHKTRTGPPGRLLQPLPPHVPH